VTYHDYKRHKSRDNINTYIPMNKLMNNIGSFFRGLFTSAPKVTISQPDEDYEKWLGV